MLPAPVVARESRRSFPLSFPHLLFARASSSFTQARFNMNRAVFVDKSVGKVVMVGTLTAADVVQMLHMGHLGVNPAAQRSLAKGAGKETTKALLQDDRVHRTPRMRDFVEFLKTVMRYLDQGNASHGFLGAIQMVVPCLLYTSDAADE